jgi:hypothetical protein
MNKGRLVHGWAATSGAHHLPIVLPGSNVAIFLSMTHNILKLHELKETKSSKRRFSGTLLCFQLSYLLSICYRIPGTFS